MLDLFWRSSNHCATAWGRQYMSAVFTADEGQKRLAEATRDREAARIGQPITTAILPLVAFYRAEDYHQKYLLRRDRQLFPEVKGQFADERAFIDSTVAARLNGYVGGNGKVEQYDREVESFGLSPTARESLRQAVANHR